MTLWQAKKRVIEDTSGSNLKDCKLHLQISNIHMCVVPGSASQDAVIKRVYTSLGLQCMGHSAKPITTAQN
jgi:hypothetical protein